MSQPFEQALNPALWDAALEIAQRCVAHELAIVSSVLASPRHGLEAARKAGLTAGHFGQDDLRLILLAVSVAHQHGKATVLRIAKRSLIADGLWDENACAFERGRLWSDVSLASLACEYPSAIDTAHHAKSLIEEREKLDRADSLFGQALATLTGAVDVLRISPVKRANELVKFTRLSKVPVDVLNEWRRRAS